MCQFGPLILLMCQFGPLILLMCQFGPLILLKHQFVPLIMLMCQFGQLISGLGICSLVFWANCSFFNKKQLNEQFAQKNKRFAHSLIFGEQPEWIADGHSFLVSDLSDLLT